MDKILKIIRNFCKVILALCFIGICCIGIYVVWVGMSIYIINVIITLGLIGIISGIVGCAIDMYLV